MGIVVGGYGISSTMWSQIQLAWTNPDNVEAVYPEGQTDGDKFFEDPDVLSRVPTLLYFMSALYFTVLTLGIQLHFYKMLRLRKCNFRDSFNVGSV